jgi:D-3-phosphoglycerate dehydrogenase
MCGWRVLLPQPIEGEALKLLQGAGCLPVEAPDPSVEAVRPLLGDVEAVILRTGLKLTRELIEHAGKLCIIARTGGGLDNVDVKAATEQDIVVTSNVGVNTGSVVEHALALMLALAKHLFLMDRSVRGGDFSVRYQNLPRDLRGKTLGLMGFGRIGSALAEVCHGSFGMKILAHDPLLPSHLRECYASWVTFVDRKTLFQQSDVVSIHVPLSEQTRHCVGREELGWMKRDAILINTARGAVLDEEALVDALREGRIAGAGLDVFEEEPLSPDSPLLGLENVIVTPHCAALTRECVVRMAVEAAQCVVDLFQGRRPRNVANPQVLKTERWRHLREDI